LYFKLTVVYLILNYNILIKFSILLKDGII
jgi:hypothetical protein